MDQCYKQEMIRVLDACAEARSLDSKAVFLFGHCNATEEMVDYLLSRSITPAAILDNSEAKQGRRCRGVPVVSPECIRERADSSGIVLIASRFYDEMADQLRRLGYSGEIVQVVEYSTFSAHSLADETLNSKTERMLRGARSLEKIRASFPSQHLVICPNKALGDVYWAMAFMPEYCSKNGLISAVVVVVGSGCGDVASMFGAEDLVTLTQTEMDELVQAVIFTREWNCVIAHHDRPYTDNIIRLLDKHFLSFIDCYRCAVYGLPKDAPSAAPTRFARFDNHEGIPKGRSVILSPYANSVIRIPGSFWEGLAADWSGRGYMVYTNVIEGERPVSGSRALRVPISQMVRAAEYAGVFIGIRNGLCDVLHTAECSKTVVFPDCCYSVTPHKVEDFFALPNWRTLLI